MNDELEGLLVQLKTVEDEIEAALDKRRQAFVDDLKVGKHRFDEATLKAQRAVKLGIDRYLLRSNVATILTIPFIYGMIIPFAFLDISLQIYQWACFSAWRLKRVKRSPYIVIDRQQLVYLNVIEKINCMFCGYGNGLIAYAREVTSQTEQYWCPIKHAKRTKSPHERYKNFIEYGDAEGFRRQSEILREQLRKMDQAAPK
jgi:hypothetical protein